jgi:hypothetical protein
MYGLTKAMDWDEARAIYEALRKADQQEATLSGLREEFRAQQTLTRHRKSAPAVPSKETGPFVAMVATVVAPPHRT